MCLAREGDVPATEEAMGKITTVEVCRDFDWAIEEIDQLRDDVATLETQVDQAEAEADKWHHQYLIAQQSRDSIVADEKAKANEMNSKLKDKMVIMIDLMDEYENMLDTYVARTGVKLMTNNLQKILELKQKGELI
jgi:cell division septum initiation protein DivIVA